MDFTEACKEQLTRQQKKRVKDHRMDYDLRNGCKNDVPKVVILSTHVTYPIFVDRRVVQS